MRVKVGADEGGGEVAVLELGAGPSDGVVEDAAVVEGQLEITVEHVGDRPQPGVGGVGAGDELADIRRHREVGDGDDVAPRVASRVAVGAELGEVAGRLDAGLLPQLTGGGVVERLVGPLEAARDRPRPGEGSPRRAARAARASRPSTTLRMTTSTVTANEG